MILKLVLIISFILEKAFSFFVDYLDSSHMGKELPENVRDVYDEKEYQKWLSYEKEGGRVDLIESVVSDLLLLGFLVFNLYSRIFNWFSGYGLYAQYLLTIAVFTVISMVMSLPFNYYDTFVIEEKYGMNKTTPKTFWLDVVKETAIGIVFTFVVLVAVIYLFETYGNAGIIFVSAVMIALSVIIALIVMPILRIFNKYDPLPDGELKDAILALCEKYGITVRNIFVKDASKRTTKANAFCTGLTKKKTIALDDNLVNNYTTDQIVAVFAHEFGHAKFRHQEKSMPFAFLRTIISVAAVGVLLNFEAPFKAFGFDGINYFFAFNIMSLISWPLSTALDAFSSYLSRKREYEADAFAAKEGYGEALIEALKKLSRDSLTDLNPHPFVVKLTYSHPTLSQRIDSIRNSIVLQ